MEKRLFYSLFLIFLTLPVCAIEEIQLDTQETQSFSARIIDSVIEKPKTLRIEKGLVDDFTVGLLFQGTSNMRFNNNESNFTTTYPMLFEIWSKTKMEDGKGELKFSIVPSRNVDSFDKEFAAYLGDIYYKREILKGHTVLLGNSRTPIGLEGKSPQGELLMINRSQLTNNYGNARAPGIRFQGDFGVLDYDIGGYSSTRSLQELGDGAETTAWVNVKPFYNQEGSIFKTLKLGGGVNYGRRGGNYTVAGVGGSWTYRDWLVNFELADATGSNAKTYSDKRSQGLYTTVGYHITDKLQVLGRYDVFDPNKTLSEDLKTQYSVGLNYYVIGQRLRFSLNYCLEDDQKAENLKNYILFMTQVQI